MGEEFLTNWSLDVALFHQPQDLESLIIRKEWEVRVSRFEIAHILVCNSLAIDQLLTTTEVPVSIHS